MILRHVLKTVTCLLALGVLALAGAAQARAGVVFKGAATSSALGASWWTISKPAATSAGDALIASVSVNASSVSGITAPPGWTLECSLARGGSAPLVQAIYSRVATATEPASYRWTLPPNSGVVLAVLAYGGVDTTDVVEGCAGQTAANTNIVTAPATTATRPGAWLLSLWAFRGTGTATPPSALAERYDAKTNPDSARSVSASAADYISNADGPHPARSATISLSSAAAVGIQLVLRPAVLFEDLFTGPDGVIADEFNTVQSPNWLVTSGRLWRENNTAQTDSNVFRATTRKTFAGDISVSLGLRQNKDIRNPQGCASNDTCWHGSHVWLRHQSQYNLYYASVNRADGKVVIKRKVPCGPDNSGVYITLGSAEPHPWSPGVWQRYSATIQTGPGNVTIKLYDDNVSTTVPIAQGIDSGGTNPKWTSSCNTPGKYPTAQYSPITAPGVVGVRGDYSDFNVDNFRVRRLDP